MGKNKTYAKVECPKCGGKAILHRNCIPPSLMGTQKPIMTGKKLSPYVCTVCWNEF